MQVHRPLGHALRFPLGRARHFLSGHPLCARRATLALCALVLSVGCTKQPPPPRVPAPAVVARKDPRSPLPPSHLRFVLEADLSQLAPLLHETLVRELSFDQPDWTRATSTPAIAQVDTIMHVRAEAPSLAMNGGTLEVAVPLVYYGRVRAKIKTPLGKVWLTQGADWGTEPAPGRVTAKVEITPAIQGAAVTTKSVLSDVTFTMPKGDKLCTTGGLRVCVSREQAAEYVHAQLERALRREAPRALAALDKRIAREGDLTRFVRPVIASLQATEQTPLGTYLSLGPEGIAVSGLSGDGSRLQLSGELWLSPAFALSPEQRAPSEVGFRSPADTPSSLHIDLVVPLAQLSHAFSKAAKRITDAGAKVSEVRVLGSAADREALVLQVLLSRGTRTAEVYALSAVETRDGLLSLASLQFTDDSRRALVYLRVQEEALRAGLVRESNVTLAPLLADHVSAIRARLAAFFLPFGTLELRPERARYDTQTRLDELSLRVRSEVFISAQLRP